MYGTVTGNISLATARRQCAEFIFTNFPRSRLLSAPARTFSALPLAAPSARASTPPGNMTLANGGLTITSATPR